MGVVESGASRNGHAGLIREDDVIRVSGEIDDWHDLGVRISAAACGDGVCALRTIGPKAIHKALRGVIHARALVAARGFDLQLTVGRQTIEGRTGEPMEAIVLYAFARRPDPMPWELAPPP